MQLEMLTFVKQLIIIGKFVISVWKVNTCENFIEKSLKFRKLNNIVWHKQFSPECLGKITGKNRLSPEIWKFKKFWEWLCLCCRPNLGFYICLQHIVFLSLHCIDLQPKLIWKNLEKEFFIKFQDLHSLKAYKTFTKS